MRRDIKFRAWNGMKMLEPQDLSQSAFHWRWLGKEDATLLQYTGIRDKNGKEIYEGDVLSYFGEPSVVSWNPHVSGFIAANVGAGHTWHDCEVIGNIYENRELIQQV